VKLASALGNYILNEDELTIVEHFEREDSKRKISEEGSFLKKKKGSTKASQKSYSKETCQKRKCKQTPAQKIYSFDSTSSISAVVLSQ
jgi:hypothetical protein